MSDSQEQCILNYLQGKLSPDELVAFELWLNESDENQKLVNDFERIWKVSHTSSETMDFDSELEWSRLQASIDNHDKTLVADLPNKFSISFLKIAASISVILVSAFIIYMMLFKNHEIIHATTNQLAHVILPDSSEVWLNEHSKIIYRADFTDKRYATLEGEGFFELKPNPLKPFVIQTGETQIKVLGTSFNIKTSDHQDQTEVYVVTGKVSFSTLDKTNSLILMPGSLGQYNTKSHSLSASNEEDLNLMAWKERRLTFKKTMLRDVLKALRNYFKTDILVKNDELLNCRFTSTFDDPNLAEVMETLRLALNLEVEHQQNIYVLNGQGCNMN